MASNERQPPKQTGPDAPEIVEELIRQPEAFRASDIHLQMRDPSAEVAYPLDRVLTPADSLPPGPNRCVLGWAAVLDALGHPRSGVPPKLFIHRRCQRLIGSLPGMQHDPTRPEDVLKVDVDEDGEGGDDAADALRYLVATLRASFGLAIP